MKNGPVNVSHAEENASCARVGKVNKAENAMVLEKNKNLVEYWDQVGVASNHVLWNIHNSGYGTSCCWCGKLGFYFYSF